jgi:hypothetical protein
VSTNQPVLLGRTGRTTRITASVIGLVLLLFGTFLGLDDHFPFGPFKMYATSGSVTGEVTVLTLQARVGDGPWEKVVPSPGSVGMNVAEFEGQQPRFEQDPGLLGAVARSYQAINPDAEPWSALRLVRVSNEVVDRVPTGSVTEEVVAEWQAP